MQSTVHGVGRVRGIDDRHALVASNAAIQPCAVGEVFIRSEVRSPSDQHFHRRLENEGRASGDDVEEALRSAALEEVVISGSTSDIDRDVVDKTVQDDDFAASKPRVYPYSPSDPCVHHLAP
jgi:hypothetical protein